MAKDFATYLKETIDLGLSHSNICAALQDCLRDLFPGGCAYICDVYGDDENGDVVYYANGETSMAPYSLSTVGGKRVHEIDTSQAKNVLPRTVYEEEADEDDMMSGSNGDEEPVEEAARIERFPGSSKRTDWPLRERFISKSERDAASASDFAGKGRSFPILKPSDVMAAVRSIGRGVAGGQSASSLKARIKAIAKRKGWTKYLPKAWQTDSSAGGDESAATDKNKSMESATTAVLDGGGELRLVESASPLETIRLVEAKADYEIKLIAPGAGSSAFYPAEVLRRDGPKVFKPGTHVYLNHATAAEEAARPEGDVRNLAGVLTTTAEYHEAHAKGPGLYGRMKVFADHAQMVEDKAPHVGMSIRASGIAEAGKMRDGRPVLKELVGAESVDVVTRAGAGGMILTESARPAQSQQEAVDMTPEEAKKLIEAAVQPFRERALKGDAREEAARLLESVSLPPAAKTRIVDRVLTGALPLTEAGELDRKKLGELVVAEGQSEGRYLAQITGAGRVTGMGISAPEPPKPKELKEARRAAKEQKRDVVEIFESIGLPKDAAKQAAKGMVA